jgi:hypothetical protein
VRRVTAGLGLLRGAEQLLNRGHGIGEALLLAALQARQQLAGLGARERVEARERGAAFGSQAEMIHAAVVAGLRARHQFAALETGQQAAEVGGIESQFGGEMSAERVPG